MIVRRGLMVLMLAGVTACAPQGGSTTTETVTTPTSPGTSSAAAYTATTVAVNETRGTNTVDVTLPQLAGGAPAVRDRFNSGMRAALEDLLGPAVDTTINDGELLDDVVDSRRAGREAEGLPQLGIGEGRDARRAVAREDHGHAVRLLVVQRGEDSFAGGHGRVLLSELRMNRKVVERGRRVKGRWPQGCV